MQSWGGNKKNSSLKKVIYVFNGHFWDCRCRGRVQEIICGRRWPHSNHFQDKGMLKKHTLIKTADDQTAYAVTPQKGMTSSTSYILRDKPTFDGQESIEGENLEKAGLDKDMKLYPFAKISMSKQSMSTAKSTYSIVTGENEFKELYIADKLSAMNYYCIVKTADGIPVLKASQRGITFYITAEVSKGVDLAAAIMTGQSTFSPDGAVGGLAGAGVV